MVNPMVKEKLRKIANNPLNSFAILTLLQFLMRSINGLFTLTETSRALFG